MNNLVDPDSPLFFFIAFPGIWIGVCLLLSAWGGWWSLAKHYESGVQNAQEQWSFQTAMMRWMTGYGNCLKVGVNDRGLLLSVLLLFRPGHPPLLVPWEDIRVERHHSFPMKGVRLTFKQTPGIPLLLKESLAREINMNSNGRWNESLG